MKVGTLIHPSWLAESLLNPVPGKIFFPLIERCVREGAQHVELTGEVFTLATSSLKDLIRQEICEVLLPYKEEQNLSFSLHLPAMGGLDVSSSIPGIRKVTVETFAEIVEITRPLEPQTYVLHVAGMILEATNSMVTGRATSSLRQILIDNALQCVRETADFLDPRSVCVENLPQFSMEFLAPFVETMNLSVCLDIGHLTLRGESLLSFLERFSSRLREVHLHDVKIERYGTNLVSQVDHHALGEGSLDLNEIIHTLCAHGYAGPLVLETLHDSKMRSIALLKNLLSNRNEEAP